MVKHPLRTKMSTMSGATASKSLMAGSIGNHSINDPEQVLRDLRQA